MTLIDQHEHVHIVRHDFARCALELKDGCGDDIDAAARQQVDQMPSRTRLLHRLAAGLECPINLVIQIHAVGDDDHPRIGDTGMEGQRLRQHDHRQRFAAARGVPDHAAGTLALCVEARHPVQRVLHGEVLLIARNLLPATIIHEVLVGQFQQPIRGEQAGNGPILHRGQTLPARRELLADPLGIVAPVVEMRGLLVA